MLTQKERYQEARDVLERHLQAEPEDVAAFRLLVRVSALMGDLGAAERVAERLAQRLDETSPIPWIELGHAFELAHRYEEALNMYDRAADVAPADPAGPLAGGLRTARWGEYELSEPRLVEALRRDSSRAEAWHALGLVRSQRRDFVGARQAYRSGLEADKNALENRVGLATIALLLNDPEAALEQYDTLISLRPNFPDAHLGRSWALIQLSRYREAEQALETGYRLGANRAVVERQRQLLETLRSGVVPTRNQ